MEAATPPTPSSRPATRSLLTIPTLLLSGCLGGVLLDTGDVLVCDATAPTASVEWGTLSLTLSVSGRNDIARFGLAETGETCNLDDLGDCWTGEDCVFGYAPGEPEHLYCHPIEPGGVTLAYAPDDRDALLPGEKTAFRQLNEDNTPYSGQVTFYLEDEDGCCYTFGHNPEYYDALGCTAL